MPTVQEGVDVIVKIVTDFSSPMKILKDTNLLYLSLSLPVLLMYDIWKEFLPSHFAFAKSHFMQWVFCLIMALAILSIGVLDSGQFIYASF